MSLKACSRSEIRECSAQKKEKDLIRERDRISELPDDILCTILSSLPTRNSVLLEQVLYRSGGGMSGPRSPSLISIITPCGLNIMKMREGEVDPLVYLSRIGSRILVDRLTLNYDICCVRKLCIHCCSDFNLSCVGKLIEVVTRLDDLEELDLSFRGDQYVKLPPSTFTRKKLVILKLARKVAINFPSPVCLPSLKELHLLSVEDLEVDSVNNFLIGCPVLEDLRLERCWVDNMGMKTLCIQSSSLKGLTLISSNSPLLKLVIDASNLERLDLFVVNAKKQVDVNCSLSSLVTAKLAIHHSNYTQSKGRRDIWEINVLELLMKMSNTKYLCLSAAFMMSLELRGLDYLPMFKNLMHLRVGSSYSSLPFLPCLVECCPNLTYFSLLKCDFWGLHGPPHRQSRTPKCLMLYLEKIELHIFGGDVNEMEMVSYFLKIAPALKKMSITFGKPEELFNFQGKVLKLPKASPTCEIDVIGV